MNGFVRIRYQPGILFRTVVFNGLALMLLSTTLCAQATLTNLGPTNKRFIARFCQHCHDGSSKDIEFQLMHLDTVSPNSIAAWREIAARVKSVEMPPKTYEGQPSAEEREQFLNWLENAIRTTETELLNSEQPVQFKRLSRVEFAYTIYDLLGIPLHLDELKLSPDATWHGIERIGQRQTTSATHVEQYISFAEAIIDEVFPEESKQSLSVHFDALDLTGNIQQSEETAVDQNPGNEGKAPRVDLWPSQSVQTPLLARQHDRPLLAGTYRLRIRLSGCGSALNGRTPHLTVVDSMSGRLLFEQDILAAEDAPVELESTFHVDAGSRRLIVSNEVNGPLIMARLGRSRRPFFSFKEGYLPWQVEFLNQEKLPNYPCLIIDSIEVEGPLVSTETHRMRNRYIPASDEREVIESCLEQFVTRASRRPAGRRMISKLSDYVISKMEQGDSLRQAIKAAYVAVLCSADFLYLVEGSPNRKDGRLDDWELASRLSYFLWSSQPDETLLRVAGDGRLSDPPEFAKQVRRMMADPKFARFSDDFCRQWLLLNQVGQFKPNAKLYPDYDPYLERSMVAETQRFFKTVLDENRSIDEFILSDWTFVNPRLARHYGMNLPKGPSYRDEFHRVSLAEDDHRGGVLTQAAILSQTSDGLRSRPVHRGIWIYEQLLGRSIPAPPANVPVIEPKKESEPRVTFRAQLDAHTSDANCASCHLKIDPFGIAFENYDAIGRWRSADATSNGTGIPPTIDSTGQLSDGRRFSGPRELQQLLMDDIDEIHFALIKKLAAYATRRVMTAQDDAELRRIANDSAANDYRLNDLIVSIALSDLIQNR